MSYYLPKELSQQFWTSLKTVYNYLSKHQGKIRIKKENGKTFVNSEDFKKLFYKTSKAVQNIQIEDNYTPWNSDFEDGKEKFTKLQNRYNQLLETSEMLKKRNTVVEKQISEYGIMLADTKKEKQVLFEKYEQLNVKYNEKVEQFSLERMKMSKNYYILFGISLMLLLVVLGLLFPSIIGYFS